MIDGCFSRGVFSLSLWLVERKCWQTILVCFWSWKSDCLAVQGGRKGGMGSVNFVLASRAGRRWRMERQFLSFLEKRLRIGSGFKPRLGDGSASTAGQLAKVRSSSPLQVRMDFTARFNRQHPRLHPGLSIMFPCFQQMFNKFHLQSTKFYTSPAKILHCFILMS